MNWAKFSDSTRLELVKIGNTIYSCGAHVRLRPKTKADAFDLMLDGRTAIIESIEQDYENDLHIAVTIDNDPIKDQGVGRFVAYRFFFAPEEVEPI
ncbi:MAG: hypothetical protein HZB51_09915 [Chloroflexi bacterium]|nr:hypothetical protein [Chloroflexota bacterium]